MGKGERTMNSLKKEINRLEMLIAANEKQGCASTKQEQFLVRIEFLKQQSPVFHYRDKDILQAMPFMPVAHCISADRAQTKGLAKSICDAFPSNKNVHYVPVGFVSVNRDTSCTIYNLVTKEKFFQKPTYENMLLCLQQLKVLIVADCVRKIAIPELGCGLDLLNWSNVHAMIKQELKGLDLDVYVYKL